jgi:hypothetical protein
MTIALSISIAGCGAQRQQRAPVPGCLDAQVVVGPGCYAQHLPDGSIEVRCPKSTTRYICNTRKK